MEGRGRKKGRVTEEHLPQRAHLLERTEQLQKSSDRLEEGIRIARETEEIGMDVMDTLQRDRETIQRMRGRVRRGGRRRGRREEERGGRREEERGGRGRFLLGSVGGLAGVLQSTLS